MYQVSRQGGAIIVFAFTIVIATMYVIVRCQGVWSIVGRDTDHAILHFIVCG
jgi:hypothetical protein